MACVSSKKRGSTVRQENACLSVHDGPFMSDFDTTSSQSQSRVTGPRNSVTVMSEHIRHLEAELVAQAQHLREVEMRADCSQEEAAHNEMVVLSLTEEVNTLREEMENKTALCKRAEQQRNQALENAEKLKEAFSQYKATTSIKFKKTMDSENKLKENLSICNMEKEQLNMKCSVLEKEAQQQHQTISILQEEMRELKRCATERSLLQAQLEEAGRRVTVMEKQLMERVADCREVSTLHREIQDLRNHSQSQE
ncbi:coiled-coil domain-containing protein 18-like, partial [Boleophthalmus pectinirostris]|uniref:coiled-coil domain-containing protein 18-like n=1 Tax=Boleophthalmus pectinirostris TaxID=150288 RepID=UPI002432699E